MVVPNLRKFLLVALTLLLPLSASSDTLKSHDCYQEFSTAFEQVKQNIPRRFGTQWKMESLPPEIASELEWITKAASRLQSDSDRLDSRAFAVHNDESALETADKWLAQRMSSLDDRQRDFDKRYEALQRWKQDLEGRRERHNRNQCVAPRDQPQVCAWYEAEAARGNAEAAQLDAREKALESERGDLQKQRDDLDSEAASLASRRTVLDTTKTNLESDVAAYVQSCEEAVQRARALVEVLATLTEERVPARAPDPDERVLKAFGQEAVLQAFKYFVMDLESPGIALAVADVVNSGMDERAREIANNTYLLGEYASALQRLKQEGRLHPGDKGYDAILHMVRAVGKEMPESNAEFTWESLTSLHTLLDGMAAACGHYVSTTTEHLGAEIIKRVPKEDKQVLGRKGVAFFKAMLTHTIQGSSSLTTEEALKLPYKAIEEQKQQAAERKLHSR